MHKPVLPFLSLTGSGAPYYTHLLSSLPVCAVNVVRHAIKGKCLIATRRIERGEVVLQERALCCTLNMDCVLKTPPPSDTCAMCIAPLTGEADSVACSAKCIERFCSSSCLQRASFHAYLCSLRTSSACPILHLERWHQARVDYSDTTLLASKILLGCVEQARHESITLEEAWFPYSLFYQEPLNRFNFGYLVNSEQNEKLWGHLDVSGKTRLKRKIFRKYKMNPSADAGIVAANQASAWGKELMVDTLRQYLVEACAATSVDGCASPDEVAFLSSNRISHTLGLVLLNSQTRYPRNADLLGQAVYAVGSCFNHSCDPNVKITHRTDPHDEMLIAVAMRDIEAGEECCISYLDVTESREDRVWYLFDHYLFDCTCSKCISEMGKLAR